MAEYRFLTVWRLPAPIEHVWQALVAADRYPEWWPNVVRYRKLTPDVSGVGAKAERVVRGRLPYSLRYTTTITRMDSPHVLAYDAAGDLNGDGRMVLRSDGDWTEVVIYWNVRTGSRWMNWLAPLLRPLFIWNHNEVMARGERGLTEWLKKQETAD
jgi:hypothetical protein